MKQNIKIAVAQSDIKWEDKKYNFEKIESFVNQAAKEEVDLIVFPEMMTTGFSNNYIKIKEDEEGETPHILQRLAKSYGIAIVCTFICQENMKLYNRALFVEAHGKISYQDKRHLFKMGGEAKDIAPAEQRQIISYLGWKFFIAICYDLRFPVWCRNVANEYDVLIATANWPEPRTKVWKTLQIARAMENLCYVVGANRIGKDMNELNHVGDSMIISPRGDVLASAQANQEALITYVIEKEPLEKLRTKFPVWEDQDKFTIEY